MAAGCMGLHLLLVMSLALSLPNLTASQGLKPRPKTVGASNTPDSLKQLQAVTQAANKLRGPDARQALQATRCNSGTAALCSPDDPQALVQQAALLFATAPAAYDARSYKGLLQPRLNPPFNQEACNLCAAAAVVAAAEAAVAATLNVPASQVHLSKTYLYYCTEQGNTCASGWELMPALNNFRKRAAASYPSVECRPNRGTNLLEATVSKELCPNRACKQTLADKGEFTWKNISSIWDVQDHIRQFGAVVTSMRLYKDPKKTDTYHLRSFYASNPGTKPYSLEGVPRSGPEPDRHAVLLVGYDIDKQEWLAFNSWGPEFADGGYFRIPYGESDIAPPTELYGLEWTPTSPVERQYEIRRASQPGCFYYKIREGDYILRIAKHYFGVDVTAFIYDNLGTIQLEDMSKPLTKGQEVLVCGATTPPRVLLGNGTNTDGFTQLHSPRPNPIGFYPGLEDKFDKNSDTMKEMVKSRQYFDGRSLYMSYGHITRICTWWLSRRDDKADGVGKVGWMVALQVTYGNHTGPVHGDKDAHGPLKPICKTLGRGERITQMYAWHGWFIDEWGFSTSKGGEVTASHRFGHNGPNLSVFTAPTKSCLASISVWTGKYFFTTGDSYNQAVGLQFDWTSAC